MTLQKNWKSVGHDLNIQKHCEVPLHPAHISTICSETARNEKGGILAVRPFPLHFSLMRSSDFLKTFTIHPSCRESQELNTSAVCDTGRMHCKLLTLGMDGQKLILDDSRHTGNTVLYNVITAYMIYFIILFYYILCICTALFKEIILALVIYEWMCKWLNEWMSMVCWWNDTDRGKQKIRKTQEKISHFYFVHHIRYVNQPVIGPEPPRRHADN